MSQICGVRARMMWVCATLFLHVWSFWCLSICACVCVCGCLFLFLTLPLSLSLYTKSAFQLRHTCDSLMVKLSTSSLCDRGGPAPVILSCETPSLIRSPQVSSTCPNVLRAKLALWTNEIQARPAQTVLQSSPDLQPHVATTSAEFVVWWV